MGTNGSNENNLVPKSVEHRRALAKMRSKLVTTTERKAGKRGAGLVMHEGPSSSKRLMNFGLLVLTCALVAAANVYSFLERDALLTEVEPLPPKLQYASPQKNWTKDEKAMYLAYAAYSPSKFDARFGPLPDNLLLDRKKAAKNLDAMLKEGGLSPLVLMEVKVLLDARDDRAPKRPAP